VRLMVAALLGVSVVVVAGGDGEGRNQNGDDC
jgi:predicted polyphosphate/ATP-dependent NAD kinase